MSKEANIVICLIGYFLNTFLFLVVPLMLKKLPIKYIRWPKREYWLAEERRAEALPRISNWLYVLGLATNIFIIFVTHCVYAANRSDPVRLNTGAFFGVMIAYVVVMTTWIVALYVTIQQDRRAGRR